MDDKMTANDTSELERVATATETETAGDRIGRMLASLAGDDGTTVKLFRIKGNKPVWCDEMPASSFESIGLPGIRDKWGAGEYDVVLYGYTQRGAKRLYGVVTRERIEIAASIAPQAAPASAEPNSELVRMIESLSQRIEAIAQRPAPAAVDSMAQMTQMFTMMKLMREAMGPAEQAKSTFSEIVEGVRMLREASSEFNIKEEPPDPLTAALPGLLELIKGGQAQQNQVAPSVSLPASIADAAPNPNPDPQVTEMSIATLKMHLAMLIDLAAKGSSIEDGAGLVYERAPDEVIELLGYPNWFDQLALFEPRASVHRAWFEQVGAAVVKMVAEDAQAQPGA